MSAEEYWDGDPQWVKAYREADRIRMERENQRLWLEGRYIYDTLCRVSPILHAFAKEGTQTRPYIEQPYPLSQKEVERIEEDKQKKAMEDARRYMEQYAIQWQHSQEVN